MSTTAANAVESTEGTAPETLRGALDAYVARVRGGDLGSLPAVLGLISLVTLFTILEGRTFFSTFNFANLLQQSAMIIVVAMGLIFLLLLGEIDLAAGVSAGTAAAVLGVTLTENGWPLPLALLACIGSGVVIGAVVGLIVSELGIPSFVVTLATFLALQGVMLLIIGTGGTIPIRDETVRAIQNDNLPPVVGWILCVGVVGAYAAVTGIRLRNRRAAGLTAQPVSLWALKVGTLAVLAGVATFFLNQERARNTAITSIKGIPYIVPVILVLLVGLTFLLTRTAFGRHVYAVGGNVEAARRAGINVKRVTLLCCVACSTLAAVAGILFASRDGSVSPSTGGSTFLLLAVGAAVIGGTSLFGGKGRMSDAVVGGLVVAVIANGLPLITGEAGIQYAVTGLVLLVAATVDALSRRRSQAN